MKMEISEMYWLKRRRNGWGGRRLRCGGGALKAKMRSDAAGVDDVRVRGGVSALGESTLPEKERQAGGNNFIAV